MRKRFVYDIETDGFVDVLTRVHCLVLWDLDTQELLSFRNDGHPDNLRRMEEAVRMLDAAEWRAGHNIIKFDEPALAKVFPFFRPNRDGVVFDTLIATRLIWPNISDSDKGRVARGMMPGRQIGSHSLDSWGLRLGVWKGDYSVKTKERLKAEWQGDEPPTEEELNTIVWATWSQEMQDYCDQDVIVNVKLFAHINKKQYPQRAYADEMAMAILCQKIEANGFPFDEKAAGNLYATLAGVRSGLEDKLRDTFGSWVEPAGDVKVPSVGNSATGAWGQVHWTFADTEEPLDPSDFTKGGLPNSAAKNRGVIRRFEGYPSQPIKIITFNPTSRFHIANRLKALYGWEPTEFTPDGEPKVDEETLDGLPFPCVPLLIEYFLVAKRLGQLAEGKQAWLKHVKHGKIHGSYNTVGAVTRRATHSRPNIGQVPGVGSAYGKECRELFGVPKDWWQVGTDASGLELRVLAHYMGRWDNGDYAKVLLTGDVHTLNQQAIGLGTRAEAKTWAYAFLYGAGDANLGGGNAALGKKRRDQFMTGLPALGNLVKAVKAKAKAHKSLDSLDGGPLYIRSDHSALNSLLQSAGSLICKRWLVTLEKELLRRGYKHGWDGDFSFLAWVHDEVQVACRTHELAQEIGELSRWAMKETEAYYQFRCPLDAEFKIGKNWAECH